VVSGSADYVRHAQMDGTQLLRPVWTSVAIHHGGRDATEEISFLL
jgi:hypothetical protein